jgi:hypothetical protein
MHSSTPSYRIVSSQGGPPKPGYTRKTSTLPSPGVTAAAGLNGGSFSPGFTAFEAGLEDKAFYSTEFSSRSDVSEKSYDIADGRVSSHSINRRDLKSSTTYTQGRIADKDHVMKGKGGFIRSFVSCVEGKQLLLSNLFIRPIDQYTFGTIDL